MAEGLRGQSLIGIKWSAFERFGVQIVQFVINLILARILTPSDYGIIGMIAIFMAISQTIIDSGFSRALIQNQNRTETDFSTAFYINIFIGIICYLILFFTSPLIADFFNEPILKYIIRVISITLFINSFAIVPIAKYSIQIDFKTQSKASITAAIISGSLGILSANYGYGVWALVIQSVSHSIINVSILWFLLRWKPKAKYSWAAFKKLFNYGGNVLGASIISTIYENITTLIIGKFYTPQDLGYFTRGQQFPALLSTNITAILQRVTFPILAKIQDEPNRLITIYRDYIKISSLGIFFLLSLLAFIAKPLILLLLTEKWIEAVIFLQIFCYSLMFDHISQINLNLLYVRGETHFILKLEIIKKLIAFTILIISIPFGVIAICLSRLIYTQISIFINTYYTGKLYNFGYLKQVRDYIPYFIISQLSCLPTIIILACNFTLLVKIILGSIIPMLLYPSILYFLKDSTFFQFILPGFKTLLKKFNHQS